VSPGRGSSGSERSPSASPGPEPHASEQTDPAPAELLQRAAEAGIHRLAIPTPFQVGRVNAYLIEDSPLTLVDSGPNSGKALDELEQALAQHGHAVEDIELLIITHQHIDHMGLASILARRSKAQVAALDRLAPYLLRFPEQADLDDRFAEAIMLRHGIPADVATALRAVSGSFRGWGSSVEITRPLHDGQRIELGERALRVLHRPGHSPSDTVFLDESHSLLLAADHLIRHISSNPLLARPLPSAEEPAAAAGGGEEALPVRRPRALVQYIASLRATREMELEMVLPGHGDPISDHVALIDERLRMHARRARRIHGLILSRPRTAHEIAAELWGNVAVTQAFLTLSEVLGHMDLLLDGARAVELERDGVVSFEGLEPG
jgi:glyoxylase-like metal-dependent hydrolase (beta-lactamase superfamily II)